MRNYRNIFMIATTIMILFLLITYSPSQKVNQAEKLEYLELKKQTEYYDWSEMETLDQNYSFSTLYLTEETEFIILKNAGILTYSETQSGKKLPLFDKVVEGQEVILQITNCAVNKDGEVLDVVIKVNNIKAFKVEGNINFGIRESIKILDSQNHPVPQYSSEGQTIVKLDVGNPLALGLGAYYASCDFTMTYYKTGTYNAKEDKGEWGEIELINSFFTDIDVPNNTGIYNEELFGGKEGVRPNVGSTRIFYNKNQKQPADPDSYGITMGEYDNGIAINDKGSITDGIWYVTSAILLTKDISNSTFSISYGGTTCGIAYFFASPYPYEITSPTKKASVTQISPGETFTYEIAQYVPNNYYANLFNFHELYDNLPNNSELTKLTITDYLSDDLDIIKENITITTETNKDVTDLFDILVQGNDIEINPKSETFYESTFYSHTYVIHIPVQVKEHPKSTILTNISYVKSKIGNQAELVQKTDEVIVDIKYKLIINYYKEGTMDKIVDSEILYYDPNEKYTTNVSKVTGMWGLVKRPTNASGVMTENIEVNYYFKKLINPDTGTSIGIILILCISSFLVMAYFVKKRKKIYKI